jgi:hypothetical protein
VAEFTDDDDRLLAELGVEVKPEPASDRTAREERIIAGFEEIQRFVEEHGHAPRHGEGLDISNGSMPCGSIGCVRNRIAARCSSHSTIRDC